MRKFEFSDTLKKLLPKLYKKDHHKYEILMKKVEEIISCEDVEHYKNLRKPLQHVKRVHIDTHFVLVFKYEKNGDQILFYDFDHHENIYRKL